MVFDQQTDKIAPVGQKRTSETQRCLEGLNWGGEGTSKFDLQKKEKNATKQTAQKQTSRRLLKLRPAKIPCKMTSVMGSF